MPIVLRLFSFLALSLSVHSLNFDYAESPNFRMCYSLFVTEIESNAIKYEINTECDYIHKNTSTHIATKAHFIGFCTEPNDNEAVLLNTREI